jgi:ADP-heptose:LPS heptosyltransferase
MAIAQLNRRLKKALWRLGLREPFKLPLRRKDARFRYYAFAHAKRYGKRRGSEVWALLRSTAEATVTNQISKEYVDNNQEDRDPAR